MSPAGRSGWSQTSARAVRKWPVSRSIVAVSNSSVAKVASPERVPSDSSVRKTETSNFEVRPEVCSSSTVVPGRLQSCTGRFCRANIDWISGLRLRSRSGVRSSTRRSKGRSWWA
ncbi:hypothetical protein ASE09_33565 [Streptomyces sp. Root66D1]|nr:hypothetical protein ASE09_33565 [Streptomyces sp. Root66D1]